MASKHRIKNICKYCGEEFTTIKSSHAKFCPDKNCRRKYHRQKTKDQTLLANQASPTEAQAIATGEVEPEILVEKDQKIETLTAANRVLRQKYRAALSDKTALECLRYTSDVEAKMIRDSFNKLGTARVSLSKEHKNSQHLVLFNSCLHYGEIVSLDETNGINEYNTAIAQASYEVMIRAVQDLIINHHSGEKFEKIWIINVGDNVSGNIHKELEITNEKPITSQVKGAGLLIALAIRDLAKLGIPIEFHGLVGNHPRTHTKPTYKQKAEDSFDRAVYEDVGVLTSQLPNVKVVIPRSPKEVININGHNFLFEHGDSIPMWMNFPWYGADRENARLTKLYSTFFGQGFQYFGFGHFHVSGFVQTPGKGEMIMTGSPKGGDEYSFSKLGVSSQPSQMFFGVSGKRGVSFKYCLDLSERDPNRHKAYQFDLADVSLFEAAKELKLL